MMQLLLAREINGNKLPDSTLLLAAGNPSLDTDGVDYQVNEMNHALKDRLTMFDLDADIDSWLVWAQQEIEIDGEMTSMIHPDIIGYLASNPDMLHKVADVEGVLPTPRSWEKVSNMIRFYEMNTDKYEEHDLYQSIYGTVGTSAGAGLHSFISNRENPLLTPEEIFTGKPFSDELTKRIKSEEIVRLNVTARNLASYYSKLPDAKKKDKKIQANYTDFLKLVPSDSMRGMLTTMSTDYRESVFDFMANYKDFIDQFLETERLARQ